MIPIFYRGHIFSFSKEPDKVGFVVKAAVVAYFRRTQLGVCQQIAGLCNPKVVDVCDE